MDDNIELINEHTKMIGSLTDSISEINSTMQFISERLIDMKGLHDKLEANVIQLSKNSNGNTEVISHLQENLGKVIEKLS